MWQDSIYEEWIHYQTITLRHNSEKQTNKLNLSSIQLHDYSVSEVKSTQSQR
jgi:hypothetical protein